MYTGEQNKISSPEINPLIHDQLILKKMLRSFNRERIVHSTNGAGAIGNCKTMKLDYLTLYVKIKSNETII